MNLVEKVGITLLLLAAPEAVEAADVYLQFMKGKEDAKVHVINANGELDDVCINSYSEFYGKGKGYSELTATLDTNKGYDIIGEGVTAGGNDFNWFGPGIELGTMYLRFVTDFCKRYQFKIKDQRWLGQNLLLSGFLKSTNTNGDNEWFTKLELTYKLGKGISVVGFGEISEDDVRPYLGMQVDF